MGFGKYAADLEGVARVLAPPKRGVGGSSTIPSADPSGHVASVLHRPGAEKYTGARGLVLIPDGTVGGDEVASGRGEQGADRFHGVFPG